MTKYLVVDASNTFFRARHAAHKQSDSWDKMGFAVHVTLSSICSAYHNYKADHTVICLEGRSWRKDFYEPYKKNRVVARQALTEAEQEEDKLFFEAFDELKAFLKESTNCTVLQHPTLEADDLVAGWIQAHPTDTHVIISTDSDYHQLLAENVTQYNGVNEELYTIQGIFDRQNKPIIDKKTKLAKEIPNPQWILFEKCMRGDSSDNVFSAYPGVRTKGSKNKTGLHEAFADKGSKGFAWNNLMLQRWTDHNGTEHRVLDDYYRNVTLIDLSAQPDHIKVNIAETIAENSVTKTISQVGIRFLKFCGKYELNKLSQNIEQYATCLSAQYLESK